MAPTVGRIVHYKCEDTEEVKAAVVTKVHDETNVNLLVFTDGQSVLLPRTSVLRGDGKGQWQWPPRAGPEG